MNKDTLFAYLDAKVGGPIRATDLDSDVMPKVSDLVTALKLPFGAEVVQRYGQAVAAVKAGEYWNLSFRSMEIEREELALATQCLKGIAADLAPTWIMPHLRY